eukprot:c742_g1_i1 orf=632-970(+)
MDLVTQSDALHFQHNKHNTSNNYLTNNLRDQLACIVTHSNLPDDAKRCHIGRMSISLKTIASFNVVGGRLPHKQCQIHIWHLDLAQNEFMGLAFYVKCAEHPRSYHLHHQLS